LRTRVLSSRTTRRCRRTPTLFPYTTLIRSYAIGDLWFNGATSDIMTCINNRNNGSYNEGDWQKRNKYTDDTYAEQVENNLNNFRSEEHTPELQSRFDLVCRRLLQKKQRQRS